MGKIEQKLLSAQKEIGVIIKDSFNPYFKSNYVDINGLLEVVKPILNNNGLVLLQPLENTKLKTIIIDAESGERIESITDMPIGADAQKQGAIITYFRRYSLVSILSLQAQDDDCESVVHPNGKAQDIINKWGGKSQPTPTMTPKPIPAAKLVSNPALIEKVKLFANKFNICAEGLKSLVKGKYNVESLNDMGDIKLQGLQDWIQDFSETNPEGIEYKRNEQGKIILFSFPK